MHADFHAPALASANLTLAGVSALVAKIVPHLATLAVLLQIAVAAVSLWQMLKRKSTTTNETNTSSSGAKPSVSGVQSNPEKS